VDDEPAMSSTALRRRLEAQGKKGLAVKKGAGRGGGSSENAENADPQRTKLPTRRPLSSSAPAACPARSMKQLVEERTNAAQPADALDASSSDEDMEMTACTGPGIVGSRPPPSTPSVGAGCGGNAAGRGRKVDVGVAGETPLQLREVVMTPNEERRQRTWQPSQHEAALSALDENSEDEIDSARSHSPADQDLPAGEVDDVLPRATHRDFRHRDSLMISHNRRSADSTAERCADESSPQSVATEVGENTPGASASPAESNQRLQKEIDRLQKVETELRAQSEYERQRRQMAEARLTALEVRFCCSNLDERVRSASSYLICHCRHRCANAKIRTNLRRIAATAVSTAKIRYGCEDWSNKLWIWRQR